jgi:hypothetical protein
MTLPGRNQFLLLESYFSDSWWNANLLARLDKGFELQARVFPIPCRFADQVELERLPAHYQGAATYINAESVCELLRKLAALHLGVPITIFLDNARYQKCAAVIALAKSLNIELCHLPSYSPILNLIGGCGSLSKSGACIPITMLTSPPSRRRLKRVSVKLIRSTKLP